jgi:hypothetical protein
VSVDVVDHTRFVGLVRCARLGRDRWFAGRQVTQESPRPRGPVPQRAVAPVASWEGQMGKSLPGFFLPNRSITATIDATGIDRAKRPRRRETVMDTVALTVLMAQRARCRDIAYPQASRMASNEGDTYRYTVRSKNSAEPKV